MLAKNKEDPSPTISIIMTAYKAAQEIGAAIESVLAQSFGDFELIICDDSSPDDTAEVVSRFRDDRIIFFKNIENLGPGPSRDRAISRASGLWLTFLDADDIYAHDRLSVMLDEARKFPNDIIADAVMDCHDTARGLSPKSAVWKIREKSTIDFQNFMRMSRTLIKPMVSRELCSRLRATHGVSRSGEDVAFLLFFFANGSVIRYIPTPTYFYRMTPGSLSTSNPKRHAEYRLVFELGRNYFKDDMSLDALDKKIEKIKVLERYQEFYNTLRNGSVLHAAKMAVRQPRLVGDFFFRAIERIPFHFDRILKGGRARRVE